MIGFEANLPRLGATFKRLVPHALVTSERPASIAPPTSASPVSAHIHDEIGSDDTTVLVQGLTWADTVDLTLTAE